MLKEEYIISLVNKLYDQTELTRNPVPVFIKRSFKINRILAGMV